MAGGHPLPPPPLAGTEFLGTWEVWSGQAGQRRGQAGGWVLSQGMKPGPAAWKQGEEPVGAPRNRRARAEAGRAGAVPQGHDSLKRDGFHLRPNSGTFTSPSPPSPSAWDTRDGEKGYCLLAGFGDHKVLQHLSLQGQGLGRAGESKALLLFHHQVRPSLGPAHQGGLLHGLAGVQTGHPCLVGGLQLLVLQRRLLQRGQLPGNSDKLLSRPQEALESSGNLRTLPDQALRPEGELVVRRGGRQELKRREEVSGGLGTRADLGCSS